MPDQSISMTDMNDYGYTAEGLLPLRQERAVELYDAGHTIYLIHPDNTETMALELDDIMMHKGIYGIECVDWDVVQGFEAVKDEIKRTEGSKEAELLYEDGNRFGIYQVKSGDELRDYRFTSIDDLEKYGLEIDRSNYELVYTEAFAGEIKSADNYNFALNEIYEDFNINHPDGYIGRSVSVSDVIVLKCNDEISSHYVNDIGFKEIHGFLSEETPKDRTPPDRDAAKTETYSQVGNTSIKIQTDAPKGRPSLMDRVEKGKQKVAQQGQPDTSKANEREVLSG